MWSLSPDFSIDAEETLLALVIPTFDEGDEARLAIRRVIESLSDGGVTNFKLFIVVDGPNLETELATRQIQDPRVVIQVLPENMGKGHAVRIGLGSIEAQFVGYLDGDLDISPRAIHLALNVLQEDSQELVGAVYGSKLHEDSIVEYPFRRRALSRGYRILARRLFGLSVEDTQTGIKIFRHRAVSDLVPQLRENGFLLDIELLARLQKAGWNLTPIPVQIDYNYSSSIGLGTIFRMSVESIRLARRLRNERN